MSGPVVSVLAVGAACGYRGPLAIAEAAAGWDQELLAAHGCRVNPATGLRVAPSARTLYRVPEGLDADELEAALTAALADAALDLRSRPRPPRSGRRSWGRRRRSGSRSRQRRGASARSGRTAGSGRTRCTRGWIPRSRGIRGKARPGTRWPWTARSARARRPAGTTRCTCSPPSPIPRHRDRAGQGCQVRQGERDEPLPAAAGPAATGRDRGYQRRDAGEPGQRPVPSEGEEGA